MNPMCDKVKVFAARNVQANISDLALPVLTLAEVRLLWLDLKMMWAGRLSRTKDGRGSV